MSQFIVQDDAVWMVGEHKPWRMSDWAVDQLLDQLQTDAERGDEGARELFNALYAAQRQAMGSLHIPRVTSLRSGPTLIVNNDPTAVVRRMLERSVEEINGPGAA